MWAKNIHERSILPDLAPNEKLRDKYNGKRCFILGNGPSIKNLDFASLADEYTFTVNQMARNPEFPKLKTNFHVWADHIFFNIDIDKPEDLALLNVMKAVRTDNNSPLVFYKHSGKQMIKKYKLDEWLDIRYFQTAPAYDIDKILINNYDITKLIPDFPTVVHQAICIAIFMGFKEIYLLGCDCTGFMSIAEARLGEAEKAEYGYKVDEKEKARLQAVAKQRSIADELIGYGELFKKYDIINETFSKKGIRIYNSTPRSLLDSFEYKNLKEVLSR